MARGAKQSYLARARALVSEPAGREQGEDRSSYERFAIPYTFKPQLRVSEAVVAAVGGFVRIVLGSLLFAVWGTYSLVAWSSIRNPLWRTGALASLLLLFLACFAAMLFAVAALVRTASPKRR